MKFRVTKEENSYQVQVKDTETVHRQIRKKMNDEEVCPECQEEISEGQVEKEEVKEDLQDEVKLTKEQLKGIDELIELLPDLKKLLGKASKEEESEKEKSEEKEEAEEEKEEKKSSKDESEEKEEPEEEKEIEVDSEILLEESDDDKEIESEEFDFDEEDVLEDEGGEDMHDSLPNPGTIETKVSDSNKDTVSHEMEVAEAWSQRYDELLNHK